MISSRLGNTVAAQLLKPYVWLFLFLLPSINVQAVVTAEDFQAEPPVVSDSAEPLVLLGLSVDHELFKKAYNDYSNLEGGDLTTEDTTYRNDFTYYGYFDPGYCYTYVATTPEYFTPGIQISSATSCSATGAANTANAWSGNFLNWATMTRMDVVRRVLYGGKRSTDDNGSTILERADLPKDVHAFVKVYSDTSDVANYTPYSTAVSLCNVSGSAGGTPLIRVASGSWRQWSAGESVQCQWDNKTTTPPAANKLQDGMTARVQVCVAHKDAFTSEDCQEYSNGNSKPVGLLQKNGEAGELRFGLISGSYDKNHAGGVLRKNISKIASNDSASDDEIDLTTGKFNSVGGIINNLDALRIEGYSFGSSKYSDCSTYSISVSTFLSSSSAADRQCDDWGNPVAEIYLEGLRYLAGKTTATTAFDATDSLSGLTKVGTWVDPMDSDEPCAQCAFIMLSSGMNSFDGDDLGSASDLPGLTGASSIDAYTNLVGDTEAGGSFNGSYLSGGSDGICSSRNLSDLSAALGICPEIPVLEGTYDVAGLAHYAKTEDLRTQTGFDGTQSVESFMVELAESLPSFSAKVGSGEVTFLPTCQANTNGSATNGSSGWLGCSLTDVEVEELTTSGGVVVSGSYLIYWEDSLWGNDYDLDIVQRLEFCVGSACSSAVGSNQVKITSSTPYAAAGNALRLSYSVSGTASSDGIVTPWALRPGGSNFDRLNSNDSIPGNVTSVTTTFTAGSSAVSGLPRPLYLAAKYGGFNDLDGDGLPNSSDEWDVRDFNGEYALDGNGNIVGDGVPDNYYQLSNPALLVDALTSIFSGLKTTITSSSAAAVVANTSSGEGAIFQSSYYPEYQASQADSIVWPGMVHALFRDENGYFREDTNGDAQLDGYSIDYRVLFFYDNALDETRVQRFSSADYGVTFTEVDTISFSDFGAIWNARDRLSALSNSQVVSQRAYGALASSGRHIITGIDTDLDGTVQPDEVLNFDTTDLDPSSNNYYRYLGLDSSETATADNIVNFVRGEEGITGFRTRAVDYDGDNVEEVWRLGDLIHSAPTSVSAPRARYDARYGDDTYTEYRQQYQSRRQVIYVGGNDGMLHAFNAGFYNSATKSFSKESIAGGEVQHPLGSELWAYVPMAVLPHLQWQTAPDYGHVYYVDGSPRVYDVNIFSDDDDHPNGWGTILVMGLRFGGGDIEFDPDSDEVGADADNDNVTTRPSYVIFDITNPEVAPKLLAELSSPSGASMFIGVSNPGDGYTTPPAVTIAGDGTGATATATLSTTGNVMAVSIDNAGSGYSDGDVLGVSGDGSGAAIVVDGVDGSGAVTSVYVGNAGSGYTSISVSAPVPEAATFTLNLNTSNKLKKLANGGIVINSGGSGYAVGDTLNFSGDGSGAAATVDGVDADGAITSVSLNNGDRGTGYNYISVDSVSRSIPVGSGASFSAVVGYSVAAIEINTAGTGYSSATVSIDAGGGAQATAVASFSSSSWGYTTSKPVVVKRRAPADSGTYEDPTKNDWYLVLGSGPSGAEGLTEAVSDDAAKLFFYDLVNKTFTAAKEFESSSFTGDLAAEDWDDDYTDDALYFGTVEDNAGTQSGALYRMNLEFDSIGGSALFTLLDTNNPIIETPRLVEDGASNQWVYVGTGRFLVSGDNDINESQYYYGIIEPDPSAGISTSDMVDVTDIQVFTVDPTDFATVNYVRDCEAPCSDGGLDVVINGVTVTDWKGVRDEIQKVNGWYRELNLTATNTTAARTVGATNLVGTTLLFSEYAPSSEECSPIGFSRINAFHYQTGTASPYAPVGLGATTYNDDGELVETNTGVNNSLSLLGGDGQGDSDDAQGAGISVDDHGVLTDADVQGAPAPYGRQSWQEININWDSGL